MSTPPPDSGRPLGRFLCRQSLAPPFIDIDHISLSDLKQDACLRTLVALHRAGKPVGPNDDPVAAFDAEPRLVRRAFNNAYRDALRAHLGRNRLPDRRLPRWRRLVSLDHGFDEVADPAQQEALDAIVEQVTAATRLLLLWNEGFGGLSNSRARKLLHLLRQLQRLKNDGTSVVPSPLRQSLYRLRADTDLPLSTHDL